MIWDNGTLKNTIETMYRQRQNRRRFYKRFDKIALWSFDICDSLYDVNFAMFCEFYENGQLDLIDWEAGDEHRKAKKQMDDLYKWETVTRPEWDKLWDSQLDDFDRNKTDIFELEDKIRNARKKNLQKLVKISDWLWT